jgi:hypothetical protein
MRISQDGEKEVRDKRAKWLEMLVDQVRDRHSGIDEARQMVDDMDRDLSRLRKDIYLREQAEAQDQWKADRDMLERVVEWSNNHTKRFDSTFVRRLLQLGKPLTDGQRAAVENIIEKWSIKLENYG